MNGKNNKKQSKFDKKIGEIAYFIIGILDIIFETFIDFAKILGEFVFKEHPVITFCTLIACLMVTITVSFASNIVRENKYNDLKNESQKREYELEYTIKSLTSTASKKEPGWTKMKKTYTISSGDTLLGLAYKYSGSYETPYEWMENVMKMNNIDNQDRIQIGDVIEIYYYEYITADLSE